VSSNYYKFDNGVPTLEENEQWLNTFGFGMMGFGIWGKPDIMGKGEPITPSDSDESALGITFYTNQIATLGKIRTDIEYPTVIKFEFEDKDSGNGDGVLIISELPNFEILPFSEISISIGKSPVPNFWGYLNVKPKQGSTVDTYEYTISSKRKMLDRIKPRVVASGPEDVGITARWIYDNYIQPNSNIRINPPNVEIAGVLHADNLDFGNDSVNKILESLAIMGNCETGIDGNNNFFFKKITDDIVRTFFVEIDVLNFKPIEEIEGVVFNAIRVIRNTTSGSGDSGWTNGGYAEDLPSIAKYGRREKKPFKVPGHYSDADCQLIADQLLLALKEPRISAKCDIIINEYTDLIKRGQYRFVSELVEADTLITECDSIQGFSKTGAGDLAFSFSDTVFQSGFGSIKIDYTSADNDVLLFTVDDIIRRASRIKFYIRSKKIGSYLTMGYGENSWNENLFPFPVDSYDIFKLIEFDISELPDRIKYFGIRLDDSAEPEPEPFYIDRIQAVTSDNIHYNLRMSRVKYKMKSGQLIASCDFGHIPSEMQGFIEELTKSAIDNENDSEIR
jgi:hypothetical protein